MKPRVVIIAALLALAILIVGLVFWRAQEAARPSKIAKKKVAKVMAPKLEKAPRAKVAIVMDDFGYNMNDLDTLFSINEPITLSVLPDLRYSSAVAEYACGRGYEVILHLPLESHRKDVKEETDTIRSGMSEQDIIARLAKEIKSVRGLSGVSNHMGSKSTEDRGLMEVIFKYLKKHRLYFFDSVTSDKSVCRELAESTGLKYARRDIFLDNTDKAEYIDNQLAALEKIAARRGMAIAVCHDRKNTIAALARVMPRMAKRGIQFVTLSDMVR
ncbi:MAG: divergent polysaccharide deacetylase family protein [Candidatus Omnitrophota bacterium]|nr:divergent polysaccharide deacetylase family protein [Candidatus Omnitrophota bacterium]